MEAGLSIDKLDPELIEPIKAWAKAMGGGFDFKNIGAARAARDAARKATLAKMPVFENVVSQDHVLNVAGRSVPLRIHRPKGHPGSLPAILWMHGGGFCIGDAEGEDTKMRRFVTEVNCVAVSVGYSLAPEHPWPAAVDDSYAALEWLADNAASLDVDPARVAVTGVSAGGCIAAAVTLMARDRGKIPVAFQLLNYPVLDDRTALKPPPASEVPPWSHQNNVDAWNMYLGHAPGGDGVSEYAAPARARNLSGLPPTYMAVGEFDPLLMENIDYARRLLAAGVATEFHVYPGTFHSFDSFAPQAAVSRRASAEQLDALRRALHRS